MSSWNIVVEFRLNIAIILNNLKRNSNENKNNSFRFFDSNILMCVAFIQELEFKLNLKKQVCTRDLHADIEPWESVRRHTIACISYSFPSTHWHYTAMLAKKNPNKIFCILFYRVRNLFIGGTSPKTMMICDTISLFLFIPILALSINMIVNSLKPFCPLLV